MAEKQEDPKPNQQDDNMNNPSRGEEGVSIPKQTASASVSDTGGKGSSSTGDLTHQQNRLSNTVSPTDTPKRTPRHSSGPKSAPAGLRSADHSPLHPYYMNKAAGKGNNGVSAPLWERRLSDGLGPSTPNRGKLKKGTETPDRSGASVPKFGDWNENDPSSADGYTQVFNRLREERQGGGPGNGPAEGTHNSLSNAQNRKHETCCGCFLWGGK